MIREVLRMGDPRLLETARTVTHFGTRELKHLVADMFATMEQQGGVGLAAPQIGVALRIVVFGFDESERYPDAPSVPVTTLINPEIEFLGDEMESGWEGCLSVPGLRGLVPRHVRLRYRGFDESGQIIDRVAEGFHARVVQHECDHLDGKLYPMRIADMTQFGFSEEITQMQESSEA